MTQGAPAAAASPATWLPYLPTRPALIGVLGLTLVAAVVAALAHGAVPLSLGDLLGAGDGLERTVFLEIRAPRVVLAGLAGTALAVSGTALQGLFRNPLADPGLIGVSSGAAVGAITMIVLGSALGLGAGSAPYTLPLAAVAGAALVTLFLYAFANRYGHFSMVTILLVGIAVNALAGVAIGIFQYVSDDGQLRSLVFWMMGSFGRATWLLILPVALLIAAASWILLRHARPLDLLQLGEPQAFHLGVDVKRLKRRVIFCSATAVGAGVAVSGIVGFVGLVVPHIARLLVGPEHRYLMPAAATLGAGLTILADLVARTVTAPAEIPVSLVTSALGAPFFLWLIARVRPR